MLPKERVEAAFRLEEPDRVPVQTLGSTAQYVLSEVNIDYAMDKADLIAKVIVNWQKTFKDDIIYAMTPGQLSAFWRTMKCEVKKLSTGWFDIIKPGVKNLEELERLDFEKVKKALLKSSLITASIKAIRFLSERFGQEYLVETTFECGFTGAGRVLGTGREMMLLHKDPEFVRRLSDFMNKLTIEVIREFVNVGANMIFIPDPNASTALISPKHYEMFAFPYEKELIKEIKKLGAITMLHICGNCTPILDKIVETGTDCYSFDHMVDIAEAKKRIGNKIALAGNINPVILLMGTPEQVTELSKDCIRKAAPGGGFMLMPGCSTAANTPTANFHALVNAAKTYGKYPINP